MNEGMQTSRDVAAGLSVLVVIPCLNEENTVASVVAGVPAAIDGVEKIQILVMDDGSTDGTAERARAAGADVVSHASNQGLGATFQEAVGIAIERGADVMVHIDGDGQFDPADIPKLVNPLIAGHAHMVTASRFLDRSLIPEMPRVKLWGNHAVAWIVKLLTGKRFRDVSCGFRAFSRETLLRMNLFGSFTYTQESFIDLIFKDLAIIEVPVSVRGVREFGTSRIASSIPRYAIRSLKIMLRAFISYRPFRLFVSIAAVCFLAGFSLLGFLGWHYLQTSQFSPHIWAGFVGGSLCFLGVSTLVTGIIGDMLVRIRMNQETMLYNLKRARSEGRSPD
ncbi:MAG: glycosyltransferase family 2 protein [Woeseiaceae bacterium]|nr:glycosyltransferase family 2 protein [Woeseiaceae bacterium]